MILANYFQTVPLPPDELIGHYNLGLVLLSYIVATFASYIALDITGRLRDVGNTTLISTLWLLGGAFAMGAGIWSMHFIGMLAFSIPNMMMSYDLFWTGLSLIVAICASGFALALLKTSIINITHFILGGIVLGFAIASMHYLGMQAMTNHVTIHFLPSLFILSIIIAIIASEAALYLALKSNQVIAKMRTRLKLVSAFIMGAAICGMHYTGMAAAIFTPKLMEVTMVPALDQEVLAITIAGITFLILGIAFFLSTYKEAKNQQLLATARQAGMAEVASSVLHNVGNVLNSLNVSASLLAEKVTSSKVSELNRLNELMQDHKHDMQAFLNTDGKGANLPEFINVLAKHLKSEQASLYNETELLLKNIEHIRNIISMQQNLSKISDIEQIVAVDSVIEEALFITGIPSNNTDIKVEKDYTSLKPVLIDKIKLLQILVNLIHNAKDSVIELAPSAKKIVLKTGKENGKFLIEVTDNGVGIASGNLTRIFGYGFTTKKSGHGFGLHTSAIAAKEMGGTLKVKSPGLQKGATFILELPYKLPR